MLSPAETHLPHQPLSVSLAEETEMLQRYQGLCHKSPSHHHMHHEGVLSGLFV